MIRNIFFLVSIGLLTACSGGPGKDDIAEAVRQQVVKQAMDVASPLQGLPGVENMFKELEEAAKSTRVKVDTIDESVEVDNDSYRISARGVYNTKGPDGQSREGAFGVTGVMIKSDGKWVGSGLSIRE